MPTFDLGYRGWDGARAPKALRWLVIPMTGIPLAWRSKMVKRAVIAAWIPALYFALAFFFYEQLVGTWAPSDIDKVLAQTGVIELPGWLEAFGVPKDALARDPEDLRGPIWRGLIYQFLRISQVLILIVLVGMIAPALIAHDIRTRAFLLYFARPLTRIEYLLGKGAIVAFYVALIVPAPALTLYTFAVLLSPDLSVLAATWMIPLQILGAFAVLVLPVTALSLMLSSLTTETRYASFSWFAIWILGWISYGVLQDSGPTWQLVSLFYTFGELQSWVFGTHATTPEAMAQLTRAAWLVGIITVGSLVILYRRISAPMRI